MICKSSNYNFYHSRKDDKKIIFIIYINDFFVTKGNKANIAQLKHQLQNKFDIMELSNIAKNLEVEFKKIVKDLFLI